MDNNILHAVVHHLGLKGLSHKEVLMETVATMRRRPYTA